MTQDDSGTATQSFGARLREHRQRRQVSIASIAESTKILGALLEGLENDDVSRWPSGLYRRAFIRAYAAAIGLPPEPVVREFLERFPDPEDPPAAPPAVPTPSANAPRAVLRLTLADAGSSFSPGRVIRELRWRCSAVAFDAFVLSVVGLSLFLVVGTLWAPLSIAAGCYYFGSILVLGNTPGVCLFASRSTRPTDSWLWNHGRRVVAAIRRSAPHWSRRQRHAPTEQTDLHVHRSAYSPRSR